jgi:hypothetical protein
MPLLCGEFRSSEMQSKNLSLFPFVAKRRLEEKIEILRQTQDDFFFGSCRARDFVTDSRARRLCRPLLLLLRGVG